MTNTECKCITDKQSEKNFVYKGTIVVITLIKRMHKLLLMYILMIFFGA